MLEQNNYEGFNIFPKLAKIGSGKYVIQQLFHHRKPMMAALLPGANQSVIWLLFRKCP